MGIGRTAVTGRVTRILASHHRESSEQEDSSLDDVEFEFLDDGEMPLVKSSCCDGNGMEFDEEENENDGSNIEDNRNFWANQHQILQETLCRSSSLESRIRNATKEALKEIQSGEIMCSCSRQEMQQMASKCRKCLMRQVSGRLQDAAYNSAICKTKWRSTPDIPSGEHNFLDVIDSSSSKKGEVRVIIELSFRAEFEMARASDDYNRLVRRLPEVFVGKVERLSNVIKIMCMAAKKCMKEKKMHMGPWRKHRYMQAKWLVTPCERKDSVASLSMGYSDSERILQKPKPKASMLTVDLLEKLPDMHCTAVEVV